MYMILQIVHDKFSTMSIMITQQQTQHIHNLILDATQISYNIG